MTHLALQTAEAMAEEGVLVEVVDLRSLKPMDEGMIAESVRKTGRAVVLHEAPRTAGLGGEVVSVVQERAFWWLKAPIRRVAAYDVPYPPYAWEDVYLPSPSRVMRAIRQVLQD